MNSHTIIILPQSHQTTLTPQQTGWSQHKMRSDYGYTRSLVN